MAKIKNRRQNQDSPLFTRVKIRPETEKDYPKITEVNDLAFGQRNEGILIEKQRQAANYIPALSLVAELDDEIIGHILFYPVEIQSGASGFLTLSLGPMGVVPEYQRRGVGSQLVAEGLKAARALSHKSVIVVGHPDYYPRFGFKPASQWKIKVPFDVPDEAFMALELVEGGLKGKSGTVAYPSEFAEAM